MRYREQGMKLTWLALALVALALSSTVAVMAAGNATGGLQQNATPTPTARAPRTTPAPAGTVTATMTMTATTTITAPATMTATVTTTGTAALTGTAAATPSPAATSGGKATEEERAPQSPSAEEGGTPTATVQPLTPQELVALGQQKFTQYCAACHQADGQGIPGAYPALAGDPFVTAEDPTAVIRVVLTGRAGMPRFHDYLTEQEMAAAISYIRNGWENNASVVTVEQVSQVNDQIYSPSEPLEHDGEGE